ncbi:MAG: hypothetical protein ACREGG_04830 [Candidatus Saccharimonadales bacterium]
MNALKNPAEEPDEPADQAGISLEETQIPEQSSERLSIENITLIGKVSLREAKSSFEAMQKYDEAIRSHGGEVVLADPADGTTYIFGRDSA